MSNDKPFRALGHIYGSSYEKSLSQGNEATKEALERVAVRKQQEQQIEALKHLLQEAKKENVVLKKAVQGLKTRLSILESSVRESTRKENSKSIGVRNSYR